MKLLLSLMSVAVFCFSQKAKANESEPNNTWDQANTLALNGSNNGSIKPAADVDWWKVKTNGDGKLSLTLTPLSGTYTYVELYDTLGTIKLAGNDGNSVFSISADGLAQGTYYLKVYCVYNTDTSSYLISNTLTKPTQANDAEPDSTKALALTLPLNGSVTGHVGYYFKNRRDTSDWYKVTTNKDGLLRLSLTPANGQYTYVTLYDHNGTTVINSNDNNVAFTLSTDGLAAGTYYLRVYNAYGTGFSPYTLADSLFSPAQANDAEPNDTKAQALTLALNGSTTGHVGYYFNNHRDTTDWYKVTTNADGLLRLSLTPANGQIIYLVLYDQDGTTVINSNDNNVPFTFNTDGLAAGTYYLRVFCYYANSGFAPYTLSDSLFTYSNANDVEPNNKPYLAKTLPANNSTPGHVGFYYNNQRDTMDWYKINYTGSGPLNVTMNLEPTKLNGYQIIYMQIWKDTLASPIYNNNNNGAPSLVASLTGLAQGYYWVRIIPFYYSGFESYTLTPTFTQVNKARIIVLSYDTAGSCSSTNTITYKCTKSSFPYTVQLYRFGVAYGSPLTVGNTGKATFSNLPDGAYYATVFGDGATGHAYTTSATVSLLPAPTAPNTTLIKKTQAKLNWTGIACADYYAIEYKVHESTTWNDTVTTGKVNSFVLKGLTGSASYDWRVASVDSLNGISAVSSYTNVVMFTTAASLIADNKDNDMSGVKQNASITVSPNPTTNYFIINFNSNLQQKLNTQLFDVNGKAVWNSGLINAESLNNKHVNVNQLGSGLYYLKIINDKSELLGVAKVLITR